jgi:hypothetical protein
MNHELRAAAVLVFLLCACEDKKDWVQERQKASEEAQATRKQQEQEREAGKSSEPAPTDPFWDNPSYIRVANDADCPEGLWSLFQDVPGGGDAERKANKAKQPELAKAMKAGTFVVKLKGPSDIKLLEYDAAKAQFPLEIIGMVDCQDSIGHLGVAWGEAKAVDPGHSVAQRGAEVQESIWQATPLPFSLPMKSMSEARDFKANHRFDLDGRLLFKVGSTEVNKKMIKSGKQLEDWGAGRLIHASVIGVRLTTDHGKTVLIDNRK